MKILFVVHVLVLLGLISLNTNLFSQEISDSEKKRKIVVERMDKLNLLSKTKAVIDNSERILEIPQSIKHLNGFTVAKTPPIIEFAIVPLENRYLKSVPKGYFQGIWSSWSQGIYYAPTQKYYAAIGNHGFYHPELYLIEYDSQTKTIKTLPEINNIMGRTGSEFGDGKIHGWLDFYNGPELYFCTYCAKYPEPSEEEYLSAAMKVVP